MEGMSQAQRRLILAANGLDPDDDDLIVINGSGRAIPSGCTAVVVNSSRPLVADTCRPWRYMNARERMANFDSIMDRCFEAQQNAKGF